MTRSPPSAATDCSRWWPTSGVPPALLHGALAYWPEYPGEVDAFVDRARTEASQAQAARERQQQLLGQ